jgi:hypothetical protein
MEVDRTVSIRDHAAAVGVKGGPCDASLDFDLVGLFARIQVPVPDHAVQADGAECTTLGAET